MLNTMRDITIARCRARTDVNRISSAGTFWYKWVFPMLWFGFLLLFAAMGLARQEGAAMLLPVGFMAVFGFILFKFLLFDLVDEVTDDGDLWS
jgi:hypothetical protein